ncbi:TIM barrel protein [Lachnoclostridium sp. Marseille-P6806]|uniref:TIM barrel protein n=1 Tax=Lachnoclostridium sp. Marseille-P6806 TaxID=2364793 RepID=UPI001031CE72|nr:TIM barrel protein [Lachnoclostridium sp. Marseille-P6806]
MGIKRGVSFYSYQQTQFFGKMHWKDMVRELHDNLKCDGVEIIDESTIPHYPFPPEEFIYDWNSFLARYDMKAVTKDIYLDVHQFRDHVMTHREAAERLKYDIRLAAEMGFENVRCLCLVPIDVIEMALPTAEKYGVRIGKEIHAPLPINTKGKKQPTQGMAGALSIHMVDEVIELARRTGSKYVGLVPDFGIFQFRPTDLHIAYVKRHVRNTDEVDWLLENSKNFAPHDLDAAQAAFKAKFPHGELSMGEIEGLSLHESSADPEDLRAIVPYICSMHGKFYEMTEIEGQPGHYEDKAINYADPIRVLNEEGYQGYIDSEYEGQRDQQDRGEEFLPNEVEEVRRHHEMLQRLFDATPNKNG